MTTISWPTNVISHGSTKVFIYKWYYHALLHNMYRLIILSIFISTFIMLKILKSF